MMTHWILDGQGQPIPTSSLEHWATWFKQADRTLEKTELGDGLVLISTVFLGLDHAFGGRTPVLWETMVFWQNGPPDFDQYQARYTSRDDARVGHAAIVAAVKHQLELMWRQEHGTAP